MSNKNALKVHPLRSPLERWPQSIYDPVDEESPRQWILKHLLTVILKKNTWPNVMPLLQNFVLSHEIEHFWKMMCRTYIYFYGP